MKIQIKYACRKTLMFDHAPDFIQQAAALWSKYNKQLVKGFASDAAEAKARKTASIKDSSVLENIIWEINSAWLSKKTLVKPIQLLQGARSEEVSFEFDGSGNIILSGEYNLQIETKKPLAEEDFDEWASDNDIQDMFMLTVKCDSDSDVIDEDYTLSVSA